MKKLYKRIVDIQKIVWRGDDLIDQSDLFELQDKIAELALVIAENENKTNELLAAFPWLYTQG